MGFKVAIGPSSFAEVDQTPLKILEQNGFEIITNPFGRRLTEDEIINLLQEADGLIAGLEPLNRKVLSSSPNLRAVARVGIGVTNIDFEAANDLNIKVSNTPDEPTDAVAEMTVAAMLTLCRNLLSLNATLHTGKWKKEMAIGLKNTKVLLIGYGRIGQKVANLLTGFGADIYIYDPLIREIDLIGSEKIVDLENGLKVADVISLHASGNKVVLGKKQFKYMKKGVIILNSARGELIDESELINSLKEEKVHSVWLDTFCEEPYKGPLTEFPQVLLTPHVSTYTRLCRQSMEVSAVKNLIRDLRGQTNGL